MTGQWDSMEKRRLELKRRRDLLRLYSMKRGVLFFMILTVLAGGATTVMLSNRDYERRLQLDPWRQIQQNPKMFYTSYCKEAVFIRGLIRQISVEEKQVSLRAVLTRTDWRFRQQMNVYQKQGLNTVALAAMLKDFKRFVNLYPNQNNIETAWTNYLEQKQSLKQGSTRPVSLKERD